MGGGICREDLERAASSVRVNLERFVTPNIFRATGDVFKTLVATVLSQNTSDRNALAAYRRLEELLGDITPQGLAAAPLEDVEEAIRPAGMHKVRARKLKELAAAVLDRFGGNLNGIGNMPTEAARQVLLSLPGVGPKTADVVLVNLGKPAFPVDTHILRIGRRLGIGNTYSQISGRIMSMLPPSEYLRVHLALIQFGREVCRARRPLCGACPLRDKCRYYALHASSERR